MREIDNDCCDVIDNLLLMSPQLIRLVAQRLPRTDTGIHTDKKIDTDTDTNTHAETETGIDTHTHINTHMNTHDV